MQNGLTERQKRAFDTAIPGQEAADIIDSLFRLGGVQVSYTSNAVANTADTVTHNLGRVPVGYVVVQNGNGGVVYDGGGQNSKNTISLKCTTASNSCTLYVF